jgi:hypothetical protein
MFYGYSDDVPLNKIEILKRVSQEEIFSIIYVGQIEVNKYICSPLRSDLQPGAWFEWYNGTLWFKDFADRKYPRDCFQFIMDFYDINFFETLKLIDGYFELGLSIGNPKPVVHNVRVEKGRIQLRKERELTEIITRAREFTSIDKKFWFDRYGITRKQLISDNVFAINKYQMYIPKKKKWIDFNVFDPSYSYEEFDNGIKKIYRPFREGIGKWITNCNENHVGGLKSLITYGYNLIITKSYKDYRVIKNLGYHTIWFQNEGQIPNEQILKDLCDRFNNIYIFYDNDTTGIEKTKILKDRINCLYRKAKSIWIPESYAYLSVKDASDLVHKKGKEELSLFLKEKTW